jgi:hypothetical protein
MSFSLYIFFILLLNNIFVSDKNLIFNKLKEGSLADTFKKNKKYDFIKRQIQSASYFFPDRIKGKYEYKYPIAKEKNFFESNKDPDKEKKLINFLSITNYEMRPEVLFGEEKKEPILEVSYLQAMYTHYYEKQGLEQLNFYFDKPFIKFIKNALLHDDLYLLSNQFSCSSGDVVEFPMKSNIFAFFPPEIRQDRRFWLMLFYPLFEFKSQNETKNLIFIEARIEDDWNEIKNIIVGLMNEIKKISNKEKNSAFLEILLISYMFYYVLIKIIMT